MTGSEQWRSLFDNAPTTLRIRALNDAFRTKFSGGRIVITKALLDHVSDDVVGLILAVQRFDDFTERNDPCGEHDFGAFEWLGETVFWKIDYYDADLLAGSPDPSDPAVTRRVMTIMLAGEY